ncbi:hypothetical protein DCO47_04105 [Pseudomonas sp. NDM]|uniref:hypothetical protein n=1 Tax=Pseudomonas sp. NDM TaxID=2170733 RepID=UPI000D5E4F91|nr:hypothetical protein [Pseudomonas sp. NDM]PWB37397.1 hypothetical protein DCO47_04105 [Pseudomonas sp. NDM]
MAIRDFDVEEEDRRKKEQLLAEKMRELDVMRDELAKREATIERRLFHEKRQLERREKELFDSVEKRVQSLSEQEQSIAARQEELERKLAEERDETIARRKEYVQQMQRLEDFRRTLEIEKLRLTEDAQQTLQDNSKKFVKSALSLLGKKEDRFHVISVVWAIAGALSLLSGVIIAVVTMISSSDSYHQAPGASLAYYFFHLFRGLVVVGLCGVLSRYAFVFSNSYMHESLKIGERSHAIRFGELYLDTYGANAQWEQVKEAFAHWNISGQSAFAKAEQGSVDPALTEAASKLLDKAMDAAANLAKKPEPS